MSQNYTLYIDESGDAGINKVRTKIAGGASPYMTMGGVLVPDREAETIKRHLNEFRKEITKKPDLHCKNLKHEQKVRFSKFLNDQKVLCFGVISLKSTLGGYKEDIEGNSSYYYNKCAQYLLERLGIFLSIHNVPNENINIIFEEGNFDYNKLKGLIATCQKSPIHPNTRYLSMIDVNSIDKKEKNEEPLLQLSDLVAHSLYRAVYGGEYSVYEPRYLKCIKNKFFKKSEEKIIGNGIYAVHSIDDLGLPEEINSLFSDF